DTQEDAQVLDQGQDELLVGGGFDHVGERPDQHTATRRLRRQDVAHSGEGTESVRGRVGHGRRGYRSGPVAPEPVRAPSRRRQVFTTARTWVSRSSSWRW